MWVVFLSRQTLRSAYKYQLALVVEIWTPYSISTGNKRLHPVLIYLSKLAPRATPQPKESDREWRTDSPAILARIT